MNKANLRWHSTRNPAKWSKILGTLALTVREVHPTDIRGMDCEDG